MNDCKQSYGNPNNLNVDECVINVNYTGSGQAKLFAVYNECYKCSYTYCMDLMTKTIVYKTIPSRKWRLEILNTDNTSTIYNIEPDLGEFGEYSFYISDSKYDLYTIKEPAHIYLPLLIIPVIFLCGLLISIIYDFCRKLLKSRNNLNIDDENKKLIKSNRVGAIDTFRGISIVLMIFVNDGAGKYEFLDHAVWNGLTVADVIFPSFLWIMGFCIPISIMSQLKKNIKKTVILKHIIKRAIILFVLGVMLNTTSLDTSRPQLETIRIFGVLQRFAVCYLVVGGIYLWQGKPDNINNDQKKLSHLQDIIQLLPQWGIVLIIICIHTLIIFFVALPDCPSGYLGPGGLHMNGSYYNCTGGATRYVDLLILGRNHMYQHPTSKKIYQSTEYDPENILGCLTSIFQVFLGVQAGMILRLFKSNSQRIIRWVIWGIILGLLGGLLCQFRKEEGWIPVNKNLWSLSFVLVTSSIAFLIFTLCFVIIDVFKLWSGKPFLYAGMNSTIMFVGHEIGYKLFPFHWAIGKMNTHLSLLVEAIWTTAAWVMVAFWLWRKKFFLSI